MPFAVTLDLDPHGGGAIAPLIDAVERADPEAVGNAIAAWQPRPAVLHKISLVRFHPDEVLWSKALVGP
ncbi:hypothetical protein QFZ27_001621 [Inquilinus ginsengisoli]|uniref:hypothetical protein n=1 Tax=Inquilinus ginsengisoli TaxID=363840 RepID=UPI003D19B881